MRKSISVVALVSLFAAGSAMASGYRIPEQSLDSTAKAGANIASASSADMTYYNPAGMGFMEDAWHFEGTATYLHLTSIDYDDDNDSSRDASSDEENFLLPTFFLVSPDYNNFRFGFSVTETYGLAKRWKDDAFARSQAQKFALTTFEFNPTVAYKFSDMFSIGGGVRMLYADAKVTKDGVENFVNSGYTDGTPTTLTLEGDTVEWGYNLAVDVKPNDSWNFALTYRSNVDLGFDSGDVDFGIAAPFFFGGSYAVSTKGDVTVPAPGVLAFSTAYTWEQWTFDLTVDRTFWSEYEELEFDFDATATGLPPDTTYPKDWDDTTCVRLGAEYRLDEKITLMGGVAYDENPVPEENLGFELPDSDAWLFSFGVRYKHSEQLEYGVAVLYDYKEERDVTNDTLEGEFSNASAFLVSLGMSYKF
jgi:long-chain fatty acid transport protein